MKKLSVIYAQIDEGKAQVEKVFDEIFDKCFLKNSVEAAEGLPSQDRLIRALDFATITTVS